MVIDAWLPVRRRPPRRWDCLPARLGSVLLVVALLMPQPAARAAPIEIEATGNGVNKDEAIARALENAVSQFGGVAISSES